MKKKRYHLTNKLSQIFSGNLSLASPRFLDGLDHESPILERGKSNHLWCNVTGHPEPEIRWEYVSYIFLLITKDTSSNELINKKY